MKKAYRVVFECYDQNQPDNVLSQQTVFEDIINKPTNCLDFTIGSVENRKAKLYYQPKNWTKG